ncbi:MAG: virulence factor [Hyphomicrobiaceae bacterium]
MAHLVVLFWRDIPAQVIVRRGRTAAKRPLSERFVQAIDRAAMRSGAQETDAYLAEWRKSAPESCGDDLEAEADRAAAHFEKMYDNGRLAQLAANGGREEKQ